MIDTSIEQEIQDKGLTAPRITLADIEANIANEHYFTAFEGTQGSELERRRKEATAPIQVSPTNELETMARRDDPLRLLTFCVLVLKNGFTVTGEAACASPENFDAEIGRKIARQNAINKVWPLMGYALKEKLSQN